MRTRLVITVVAALFLAGVADLSAQRRRTGGTSSPAPSGGTRQSPPSASPRTGGSSGSGGGERRRTGTAQPSGSSSGERSGTVTRRGGEERATPERREGEVTTRERPEGSSTAVTEGAGSASNGGGRIAAVRDRARAARIRTSRGVRSVGGYWVATCFDCSYWGWYRGYWGWYDRGWWYPGYYPRHYRPHYDEGEEPVAEPAVESFGTTFLDYPYAGGPSGATFVQEDAPGRRAYGAITMQYFGERSSEVEAGRVALEYGYRRLHGEIGYTQYAEPVAGGVDRLHTWRASLGAQPRLSDHANLVVAVAFRGITLTGGDDAYGAEAELGLQLLPVRPIGINLNGRAGLASWTGSDQFGFQELNATGSVFVGRVELQAGWHYFKLDTAPAFTGPMAGLRVWF